MAKPKKIQIGGKKKIVIRSSRKKRWKAQFILFLQQYRTPILGFIRSNKVPILATLPLLGIVLLVLAFQKGKGASPIEKQELLDTDTLIVKEAFPKVESKANFAYPELLPDDADKVSYQNSPPLVIEENTPLNIYFQNQGLDKEVSEDIAFQAKFKGLTQFEHQHTLYTFKVENNKDGYRDFFIYEMAVDSFAIITLNPIPKVKIQKLELSVEIKEMAGIVKNTFFWTNFLDNGGEHQLIPQLLEALKWKIDFYHVHPNDRYKLIYEQKSYNGEKVELGNLLAVHYQQRDSSYYAFRFGEEEKAAYFDQDGQIMRMRFLKSPVEYNIINSHYDLNRMHPIHKKEMPHKGTDYFANRNDPVFAVGRGRIVEARFSKYNGKYVKIWHDKKYQTQYLHLNKIADKIRPGKWVEQGDIIGYAGDTGLASGVHVCFRFWVDGKQLDFTKNETSKNKEKVNKIDNFEAFERHRDSLQLLLDDMVF